MNVAVVVAGGRGERFGEAAGKQLTVLAGRPMLAWTLKAMEEAASIDAVVVTYRPDGVDEVARAVEEWGTRKVRAVVAGGDERQHSVRLGLEALPAEAIVVAVHDGARPLVLPADIDACVQALPGWDGVVLGRPAVDTIKRVNKDGSVESTLERASLWQAETPQVFAVKTLREAHRSAEASGSVATDDASLVELAGGRVRMVAAMGPNLKVTLTGDVVAAEAAIRQREEE